MGDRSSQRRIIFPILIAAAFVLLQTAGHSQDRPESPGTADGASQSRTAVGAGGDERALRGLAAELRRSRAAGDLVRAAAIFAQMFHIEAIPDAGSAAKVEAAAPTCRVAAEPSAGKDAPGGNRSVPVFNSTEDERNPAAEIRRSGDGPGILVSAAEIWTDGRPGDIGVRQSPDGGRTWTGLASLGDGHPRTRPVLRQITGEAMGLVFAREWSAGDGDIIFASLAPDLSGGAEYPIALSGADQRNPSLATDHPAFPAPYVYAAYAEREGLAQAVRFRVSPDLGASWSEAVTIASRVGPDLREIETALAYDPGKHTLWAAFTWPQGGSTGIAVAVSRTCGASWSPPVFVTTADRGTAGGPRIAAFRGTAIVAYEREAPEGGFDIGLAASMNGGRSWTATGVASTAANERYPDVRVVDDKGPGRFWVSFVEEGAKIHVLSRDETGSWTTEAAFETGASSVASGPVEVVPVRSTAGRPPEAGVFWTSNGPDADVLFGAAGPLALADLVVTPGSQDVPSAAGTTSFSVSKSGEGRVDWTAAVVTGSDWLSIQSGDSGSNSGTIVAAFTENSGPDPRTGSIRVSATDQAIPSVTVTVVQAGAPRLGVSPAEGLTASGLVGGPFAPAGQAYTLRNEGTAAIDWAAAKTEPWISLSGASGTLGPGASTTVTVSFNAAADGLASGTYSDTVAFTNATNGLGSTTRPVSLTVTEPPGVLSVTPAEGLTATGLIGGPFTPSGQTYTLRNAGAAPLDWTAARTEGWTSLSATAGTLAPGDSATVTVSINAAAEALPAGSYNDSVSFTNTTDGLGSTTRTVSLTVTAPPGVLTVSPTEGLISSGLVGGPFSPASRAYSLQNTGGTSLDWTASRTRSWTSLSAASGTLAPGDAVTVTVSINAAANALAAGIYTDTVAFANATTGNGSTTRPVELTVTAPGVLTVTPSEGLDSTGLVGGPFTPSSRTYTLRNAGGVPLDWTAARTRPWTSLSAAAGTLAAGEATTVTVSINAAADSLPAGVYGDTVSFTNATDGSGSTSRAVGLTVTSPPGVLTVTPAEGLAAAGPEGGPFTPSSRVYTLQNTGGSSLDWTASKLRSWTSLSAAAGTLAAGDATTVTVSINASAGTLASGAYADTISFVNATTGNGSTTRPVTLTVTSGPALSVTPSHRDLPFTGGATTFDVANVGGGTMVWTAAVISGSDWLGISAGASGTDAGTIAVVATANRTSLDRTGTIRVTAAGAAGSPKDVTVSQVRGTLALTLGGQRLVEKAWIIEREFGRLTVAIDNPAAVPVETYILYRRSGGGADQIIQQIDGGTVSGSPLILNDAFLEPGISYTYRIAAVDAFGVTLAVSNEITI